LIDAIPAAGAGVSLDGTPMKGFEFSKS